MRLLMALLGAVTLAKTETVVSDPVNGSLSPKAVPSAVVEYAITMTNSSGAPLDAGALAITDAIPARTALFVGGLAGASPVATSQGLPASGLSTVFTSLASTTDDLEFSNNNGASYTYVPSPDAAGYDRAVTNLRIRTRGVGAAGGVYKVRFRVRVR